jgi:hypothetical protein
MKEAAESLPCVQWGEHRISRLLLGHNMAKGTSHRSDALSDEMREWHAPELGHDLETVRRAEECGINTVLFGGPPMHSLISRHKAEGGEMQWLATVYDGSEDDAKLEEELRTILAVDPRPTGLVYYGERTDTQFVEGRTEFTHERLKRLRETGLLVGVGSHLPDAVGQVESAGWDVDFYMTCFYTVYSHVGEGKIDRGEERYDDADRDLMVAFIKKASKPCVAFKVLAAGRKCGSDRDLEAALRFAYANIKPTDVVGVGMWQKHTDQVGQNARLVSEILGAVT